MRKILQKENKILRQISKEVFVRDIKTAKIKKVLREMSEALKSQNDGVAIAAPQVGYSLRIFVVSGRVFSGDLTKAKKDNIEKKQRVNNDMSDMPETEKNPPSIKDSIFINPKISKLSQKKEWLPEGCLSVRPLYGKTFRSMKATITAYDESGKKFTRGASGLLAQIFQHETDHLNGILFIDHAKEIRAEEPK